MASRQQKAWFVPVLVLLVSVFLIVGARVLYQFQQTSVIKHNWTSFWLDWGSGIGLLCTILLAAVVATLPSRVDSLIEAMGERIQSPLSNFGEVAERAINLLEWIGTRPGTVLQYTSATTVLGVELGDTHIEKWRRLLVARIEAGCTTEIVCLDPSAHVGRPLSPLGDFCKVLAEQYLKDAKRFDSLWEQAHSLIEDFERRYSSYSNCRMRLGGEPPFQLVIARDEKGFTKAILYFASSETLKGHVSPSGFSTEDARMCEVLKRLFEYVTADAAQSSRDGRTDLQKKRDAFMQRFRKEKDQEHSIEVAGISNGFQLLVKPGVFSPEIEVAKKSLYKAIETAAGIVWATVDPERRIGIDVGSGTGILALYLAKYAPAVLATDIGELEISNIRANIERFNQVNPEKTLIATLRTNLLEHVEGHVGNRVPLIVFNHPYYPSPSNVFNVGGAFAGLVLIRPFLEQAHRIVRNGGGVIMPYAALAERHNPLEVATELGFTSRLLGKDTDEEYGDHSIYLFTIPSGV